MIDRSKDYLQQLADYIKKNLAKGYTLDSLKFALQAQGYSRITIENAIRLANEQLAATAPIMKEKPQISYRVIPEPSQVYEKKKSLFNRILNKIFKIN